MDNKTEITHNHKLINNRYLFLKYLEYLNNGELLKLYDCSKQIRIAIDNIFVPSVLQKLPIRQSQTPINNLITLIKSSMCYACTFLKVQLFLRSSIRLPLNVYYFPEFQNKYQAVCQYHLRNYQCKFCKKVCYVGLRRNRCKITCEKFICECPNCYMQCYYECNRTY